jgi:hypothetical protein
VTKFDEVEALLKKTFAGPTYQITSGDLADKREVRYSVFIDQKPLFMVGFWQDIDGNVDHTIVTAIAIYFGLWGNDFYETPQFFEFYESLGTPQFLQITSFDADRNYLDGVLHYPLANGFISVYTAETQGEVQFLYKSVTALVFSTSQVVNSWGVVKWRGLYSNRDYIRGYCSTRDC